MNFPIHKHLLFLLFFSFCISTVQAQGEANIWYFGGFAGIDFNSGTPVALDNSSMTTNEGCSSISDSDGSLLFYTDGVTVWDKTHGVMQNGFGLQGDFSSTQSSLVVPKPGSSTLYYIFTVDSEANFSGVRYSEVDLTLNNGNGAVTSTKNVPLITPTAEKLTAVAHGNGQDFWVVTHGWNNNNFYAYLVDSSGVDTTPVVSSVGSVHGPIIQSSIGYLKFSPNGERLASAQVAFNTKVELFDFNNNTGVITNDLLLDNIFFTGGDVNGAYGIEFSPDSSLLYVSDLNFVTNRTRLRQFDITSNNINDIIASDYIIDDNFGIRSALQLGPDNKIYITSLAETFLNVINNPDVAGVGCNYQTAAVSLGSNVGIFGLPQFIQSFFNVSLSFENTCLGDGTQFTAQIPDTYDSILWDFGDTNTSTEENPTHTYDQDGVYTVTLSVTANGETVVQTAEVSISSLPEITSPEDITQCENFDATQIVDLTVNDLTSLITNNPNDFVLNYYNTQNDADTGLNPITNPQNYQPTSNPSTIYIRIENIGESDCFITDMFDISFFDLEINSVEDLAVCAQTNNTGQTLFDLSVQNDFILGSDQDETLFNIIYYTSQSDAQNETNPIQNPENYTSTNNLQTIWVRVQNVQNTSCYTIIDFNLIVNEEPIITNTEDLLYCGNFNNSIPVFDLTLNNESTVGVLFPENFNASYYLTIIDAENTTNAISNPETYNLPNGIEQQTIFIRIENEEDAECADISSFEIVISNLEIVNPPTDLEVCGIDNTLEGLFDLTQQNDLIFGNNQAEPDYSISYFDNELDANNGVNPITDPTNYASETQEIWVRIDNLNHPDDCYELESFQIIARQIPEIFEVEDIQICGDFTFTQQVDLAALETEIFNGSNTNNFVLDFYTTFADATNNVNALANTLFNPSEESTTLFFRASNPNNSSCFEIGEFNIVVNNVEVASPPLDLEVCGIDNTLEGLFDLTQQNDVIFGNNQAEPDYSISYFDNELDANNGVNPITDPTNYVSETQEIWVRIDNLNHPEDCYELESFQIIARQIPEIFEVEDIQICGDFTFTQQVDLAALETEIFNGSNTNNFVLDFYTTFADATNNVNALANTLFNPSEESTTLFFRASNPNNSSCFEIGEFNIVVNNVEVASPPLDLEVCGIDNTLEGLFDLTQQNDVIFGNNQAEPDYSISYFDNELDANNGVNPITDPTNYVSETQEIWVRIDNLNHPDDCYELESFQIIARQIPEIFEVEDIQICGDFTFTQQVDLAALETEIFNGSNTNNFVLDFYTTFADATNNVNALANTLFNPSEESTTLFFRASNPNNSSCFEIGEFNIVVNNVEVASPPLDLEVCGDGTGNLIAFFDLTMNTPLVLGENQTLDSHGISFHTSLEDATLGNNAIIDPTAYENTTSNQEIWIRIISLNDESCFEVRSFLIDIYVFFNSNLPPLEACDENNDGFFSNFDLDSRIEEVNFLNNPDVQVSFHPTASDAETNQNPLTSPYANVVEGQQTIHVRVLDTGNGCLQTTTLELIIYDSPLLLEIDPIIECDTAETGIQFFDLTQVEENLFVPGQDTEDFIITYHLSEDAANNNTGLIGNPEAFQNTSSPQTVYIRVSDPASPLGCFNIEPIELIVDPLPEITPPTLIAECDDIESGSDVDEVASFDLTQKVPEITNNDTALDVFFYATEEDQANDNPITNIEEYQNIVNPQTIEVSVFSPNTDCVATTTLTLVVDPLPTIPEPEPLIVCDADNEGTSEFDLQAAVEDILDGEVNTQITFHLTEVDANNADNPIVIEDENGESILFQNFNPFTQTLYIRAENIGNANINGTGCFTIRPLELQVVESPRIEELEDLVICDDESLNGFAPFDLVQNTANAIGEQESENLVVTYHVSQADAELGLNEISVPSNYTNITNPQTIYVRLFDTETECVDLFGFADDNSFTLTVEPYPDLITPTPLEVCNTTANPEASFPTGTFDLTQKEEELTGLSPVPGNISFTYYENETDLGNSENAIENPEEYINSAAPPMLIYVEATNTSTENQCSNTSTITLSVLPLPFPVELTEEELRLTACDDDNDGIAADPFDLTQIGQQITGSENNVGSYYLTEDAAINEDIAQQIADPTAYVNEPALNELDEDFFPTNTQIVWVRLDSNAVGNFCFVVVQIELIVEPNPELNPAGIPFGYTLCEGEPTQLPTVEEIVFSLYDVTNGSPNEIIPVLDPANTAQDPADYEYSLHLTEAEAEAGTNPVAVGYEATDGEILYLRVTHIITECYNIGNIPEIQITIEPRPEITDTDLSPIVVCADEQLNDADQAENQEVATIDLTQRDAEIDPNFEDPDSNTLVEYYASEEDLNNGIPIEDPTNFTTTETPTTIFAQVIDLDNFCSSFTSQSFEIQVNPLPLIDISDMDGSIVCINPQTGEVIETDFSPPVIDTGLSEDFYSFEWTLNGTPIAFTGSAYTVDGPGIYTVTVTDITNNQTSCQASSSAEIIQSNGPSFEVNVLSLAFDGSHSVEVTNIQGDGDYEFQVDNGPWRSLAEGETSIIFTGLDAGERIVRGRDLGGCGEVEIIVSLIDYPRFFTPNEDGYNDTWNIIGLANQVNAKIYIFDRYGKLLKQISPSGQGWDGTYNGKVMLGNDYWFRVEYDEPANGARKEFKANFTLKR